MIAMRAQDFVTATDARLGPAAMSLGARFRHAGAVVRAARAA